MNKQEILHSTLSKILDHIGVKPELEILPTEENTFEIRIKGDNLNFLIGYQGQSLEGLQSILSMALLKQTKEPTTVILDINGYKDQKAERIHSLTKSLIDKVRFFEKEVEMPPMSAWERRQVHVFIAEYNDITSESTGDGRARRVVLKPRKK